MNGYRLAGLLVAAALLAVPVAAADKPSPPQPPDAPRSPPGQPPSLPGSTVPASLQDPSGNPTDPSRAVTVLPDGVGFEPSARTAAVEPGRPLRGQVRVSVRQPTEVEVVWRVDGTPHGRTRTALGPGTHVLLSPPLPTQKPGRFVLDAEVNRTATVATSYTVVGPPAAERLGREVSAVLLSPEAAQEVAARFGLVLLRTARLESGVLATYEVPAGLEVRQVLQALSGDPEVLAADQVSVHEVLAGGSLRALQYAPRLIELPAARRWASGRGVRIAVVDTGVDADHPEFRGQVERVEDFTGVPYAPEVHGTAVVGVIAASANLMGVAPGARVVVLRACTATRPGGLDARCRSDDLVRAFDRAIRLRVHVLNASLGGPPDPLLRWAVRQATARGVLVVAAAGQLQPGVPTDPAGIPGVLTVGAVDARSRPDAHSNGGTPVSLLAPGVDVLTTLPGGRYVFVSGTSFAAAHATGAAALFWEVAPGPTGSKAGQALQRNARQLGVPGPDGPYGLLSACRPLAAVSSQVQCP